MRNSKKGFTIIELVIVIAVIAILAGVMIPTFASVTNKAKESAALQTVEAAQSILMAEENAQLSATATYYFINTADDTVRWYKLENGQIVKLDVAPANTAFAEGDAVYASNDTVTVVTGTFTEKVIADLGTVIIWRDAQ